MVAQIKNILILVVKGEGLENCGYWYMCTCLSVMYGFLFHGLFFPI